MEINNIELDPRQKLLKTVARGNWKEKSVILNVRRELSVADEIIQTIY